MGCTNGCAEASRYFQQGIGDIRVFLCAWVCPRPQDKLEVSCKDLEEMEACRLVILLIHDLALPDHDGMRRLDWESASAALLIKVCDCTGRGGSPLQAPFRFRLMKPAI